jgi:hypothetical protein
VPLNPSPNDPVCPSCRKPIKHGTPVVVRGGQTLHLRCWTLSRIMPLERNRTARAGSRDRQLSATPWVPPEATTTKKRRTPSNPASE